MDMVDYFVAYNFKISWVGAYRGVGGYWNVFCLSLYWASTLVIIITGTYLFKFHN